MVWWVGCGWCNTQKQLWNSFLIWIELQLIYFYFLSSFSNSWLLQTLYNTMKEISQIIWVRVPPCDQRWFQVKEFVVHLACFYTSFIPYPSSYCQDIQPSLISHFPFPCNSANMCQCEGQTNAEFAVRIRSSN